MKDTEGRTIYQIQHLETGEVIACLYDDNTPVPPSKVPVTAQEECDYREPVIMDDFDDVGIPLNGFATQFM